MKLALQSLIVLLSICSAGRSAVSGDWTYTVNSSNEATVTAYTGVGGAVQIPSSLDGHLVKQLGSGVYFASAGPLFYLNAATITSVTIPEGVTLIEASAFFGCASLTSVTIPDSVTGIGGNAFGNCEGLTNVTIGNGVTSIGEGAFSRCTRLTSVTIGSAVTIIREDAFSGCQNLTSLYFRGNMPSVGSRSLRGINRVGTVFYPRGNTTWDTEFGGYWEWRFYVGAWPTKPYDLPSTPSISVEEPSGTILYNNTKARAFDSLPSGFSSAGRVYTIRNAGTGPLNSITLEKLGSHTNDFAVTLPATNAVVAGGSTMFSVSFTPTAGGTREAQISIASNDTDKTPFVINLSGTGVSANADTDKDGLNDAAELTMQALGFDWKTAQPALVGTLMSNANRANLFTKTQYDSFGALRFSNGQSSVRTNPSGFNLVSRTNIPAVRMALSKNAAFTLNLGGTWTRYGLTGRDRAWTFNTNTGELKGTLGGTNERTLRLVPYNGSQAGPQMIIQLRPAP